MNEFLELVKMLFNSSSPALIFFTIIIALCYKAKSILYNFLDIKDLSKKRLIQKYETVSNFKNNNSFQNTLNINFDRLCEESQLQALIGCKYCSKEIAEYIFSRKNISLAIMTYNRVKNDLTFLESVPMPKQNFPNYRIKINIIFGNIFYFFISFLAFSPILLPSIAIILQQHVKINLNSEVIFGILFYTFILFSFALFVLNESLKPKLIKKFCEMPSIS